MRGFILTGLLVAAGASAPTVSGAALEDEIASLIKDLGSESYQAREKATKRLWEIGEPAVAALTEAAKSKDPEISLRAGMVLRDLRMGIRPDWPVEIISLARRLESGSAGARRAALEKISQALKGRALRLLLGRLAVGSAAERSHALQCIQNIAAADKDVYPRIIRLIKEPKNDYEGQALILARLYTGDMNAALKLMARHKVGSRERAKIISGAVDNLLNMLGRYEFQKAAAEARSFAEAAPTDARFLYLQAEALAALDQDARAAELRAKALAMHPAGEAPHYTAGELLQHKLGRRALAEEEWKKILSIPPAGGVYDSNAYIRLHSIYAECGRFGQAAECLGKALAYVEAEQKKGHGVGIAGASVQALRKRVQSLNAKARGRPGGAEARITDRHPDNEIRLKIDVTMKEGKLEALRKALGEAAARVTIDVQPRGARLLDKGVLAVRYDAAKAQLGVYLNNNRCCRPVPLKLQGKTASIAVRSLDCWYLFEVEGGGGVAKRVARFEKDYKVIFQPGNKIAACREITVAINGKSHQWEDLLAGLPFDYLPKEFSISLTGTRPSGRKFSRAFKVALVEPEIAPKGK